MILAGGHGSRLYPLTKHRSKPAVPIAGKFRLIDIPISNSIHSGFRRIFIVTQFSAESLHSHIFQTYRFSIFSKDFITILSAQQTLENRDWYQGTADAVRQNMGFITRNDEYALILSGDHLYRMDYGKFLKYHIEKGADISISMIPIYRERAGELGVMSINNDSRVINFFEKPKDDTTLDELTVPESAFAEHNIDPKGRTHLASMGIYVFNKKVLNELLQTSDESDFGKGIIPRALERYKVFAYLFDGYWEDIGTIGSFFEAHVDLTRTLPEFNFYDEELPIFTKPRFLPGAKVRKAEIENTILCDGSIVNSSTIKGSIIGIRSIVGSNCYLDNVIMMGADYFETHEERIANREKGAPYVGIGENCVIERAIIDKNARIGNNVRISGERSMEFVEQKNYAIRDGIVVIPKNAVIPDDSEI
jgi:glucose-1-phosphate adenylyltransferase